MENKEIKKEYSNGDLTIVWKPRKCFHSGVCAHGLPDVFKPKSRPWITMGNATNEELKNLIHKCPSRALTYYSGQSVK